MSTRYHGLGTLQLNRGIDLPRSPMSLIADTPTDGANHGIRLTLKDYLPGGCSMQITLTVEAAASLASEINALAQNAVARDDDLDASDQSCLPVALTA